MLKRLCVSFCIAVLSLIFYIGDVSAAYTSLGIVDAAANGYATLLCNYTNTNGEVQNQIYYVFMPVNPTQDTINRTSQWNVFYRNGIGSFTNMDDVLWGTNLTQGSFDWVFRDKKRISYNVHGERMESSMESRFTCPLYSFNSYSGLNDEMCFGDDSYCGSKFKEGPFNLKEDAASIFSVMNEYIRSAFNGVTFEEYKKNNNVEDIVKEKALKQVKTKYSFDTTYETPKFVENYVNNFRNQNIDLEAEYNRIQEMASKQLEEAKKQETITEEEQKEVERKLSLSYSEALGAVGVLPVKPSTGTDCNSVLGSEMSEIVNNLFTFIQYLGPILVVVLTAVDMLKAALSGEQDDMKKATNKFSKRLIAAVLLFFVPLLCNIIFQVTGVTVPDSCIGRVK